jgi:hypothetical protein
MVQINERTKIDISLNTFVTKDHQKKDRYRPKQIQDTE